MDPFAPMLPTKSYISPAAPMQQPQQQMRQPVAPSSANQAADPFLDMLSPGVAPSPYATAPKSGARDSLGDLDPFTPSPTAATAAASATLQQSQRSQRAPMSNPRRRRRREGGGRATGNGHAPSSHHHHAVDDDLVPSVGCKGGALSFG